MGGMSGLMSMLQHPQQGGTTPTTPGATNPMLANLPPWLRGGFFGQALGGGYPGGSGGGFNPMSFAQALQGQGGGLGGGAGIGAGMGNVALQQALARMTPDQQQALLARLLPGGSGGGGLLG